MKECTFRLATLKDYGSINRLKNQVHDYHCMHRPDFFKRSDHSLTESYFNTILNSEQYFIFIIEVFTQIVAYAITSVHSYETNPLIADHKRLFIEDVCVDEKNRYKGIGTYLFKTMEEFCKIKQINYIVPDVWNFNEEAIKFYKRIGMNPVTQRFEKPVT